MISLDLSIEQERYLYCVPFFGVWGVEKVPGWCLAWLMLPFILQGTSINSWMSILSPTSNSCVAKRL